MLGSVQQAPFRQNASFLFPKDWKREVRGGTERSGQSEKAAVRGQVRSSSWTRIKKEGDRLLLCGPPCFSQRYNTATFVRGRVHSSPAAGKTCRLCQSCSSQHTQSLSELGQLSFSGIITQHWSGMVAEWRNKEHVCFRED